MNPIWITGAGGLIGNYLVQAAPRAVRPRVIGLTRAQLDLCDLAAVRRAFRRDSPELVIHCAAMTHPPTCEAHPDLAQKVNVEATELLVELGADIPFIFFSSDLVFDGSAGNYDESAPAHPLGLYGQTKSAAEQIVLANPNHTVVRTSLNGGTSPGGVRAFNEQLRRAFEAGRPLKLFTDEFRSPIPACETARAVWELATLGQCGLFHIAGAERLSRWQIGRLLAARWPQLQPKIEPASIRDYSGAPRAPDTSLACSKVQKLLSFPLPGLTQWLSQKSTEAF